MLGGFYFVLVLHLLVSWFWVVKRHSDSVAVFIQVRTLTISNAKKRLGGCSVTWLVYCAFDRSFGVYCAFDRSFVVSVTFFDFVCVARFLSCPWNPAGLRELTWV